MKIMPPNHDADIAAHLIVLFEKLKALLQREDGQEWMSSVNALLKQLRPPYVDDNELHECLRLAKSMYRTINRGPGSFVDFYVWREDFHERRSANVELDSLKYDIATYLHMID
jgi:hypothetical protein